MKVNILEDNIQETEYNKKIFKKLTNTDFDSIVNPIIKKLNKNEDEIQLTFFFNINTPHFVMIEKISSKMPAIEYFKVYCESDRIKEIETIFDIESYQLLEVCKIYNKNYTEIENNIKI